MITFIHTADVHYGMENYGKIDPQTGIHSRLLDFDKAFNYCIDVAIERQVDLFLFAGDAYKTTNPSPTQQRLLLKSLLRLHKAGIPIVIAVGNHDNPLSFGKSNTLDMYGDLPLDGFHVIAKPTSFTLKTKNGPIQIVGIPWPTRNTVSLSDTHKFKSSFELTEYISGRVHSIINHFAQQLDPEIPAVLMGHLTVTSGIFSGSEKRAIYGNDPVFLPSQLAIQPFDYVALGHLHRYQNLNENGYPPLVYSGSIERIDFGERKEDKGFCLVSIHEKNNTTYEFIKTPQRPFIQIEVSIKSTTDESQTSQIIEKIKEFDLTDAIVKIMYHLPPELKDMVDLAAIQRACHNAQDIVAIIPIYQPKIRTARAAMKIDMDLITLLQTYFKTRPELENKQVSLIEKALQLKEKIDNDIKDK
ncbi:MAG: exonuclease subunit SbcD [Candidatus Babeliales bacterium]